MKTSLFVPLLFCAVWPVASARADLVECNGTWTNKECNVLGGRVLDEKQISGRSPEAVALSQKKLLVEQLDLKRYSLGEKDRAGIDISSERSLCLNPQTALSDCRSAVDVKRSLIDQKLAAIAKIEAEKKKALEKSKDAQADGGITVEGSNPSLSQKLPRSPQPKR